eukprot:scaffold37840_cov58-Phaeocystis_antarctica.AAC.5
MVVSLHVYRSHGTAIKRRGGAERRRWRGADLRCDSGGVLQELDDLRVPLPLGEVQRGLAILRRGEGRVEVEAAAPGGEGWTARRGGAAPAASPRTPTPPSSALCATAHRVLEARVGPRLEQRLDAGSVADESRGVQRRPPVLPRRGGGPTHANERRQASGRRVPEAGATPQPTPRPPNSHNPARSSAGLHASYAAEGRQPAAGRQHGAAAEGRSGASGAPSARGAAGQLRAASPRSPAHPTPLAATPQQGRGAPCPGHSGWRPWR